MGCGSSVPVHPAPPPLAEQQQTLSDHSSDVQTRIASLEERLAHANSRLEAKDAEILALQAQLAESAAAQRGAAEAEGGDDIDATIKTLEAKLVQHQQSVRELEKELRRVKSNAASPSREAKGTAVDRTDPDDVQVQDFASGLEESLLQALVDGLVKGLGLEHAGDPRNIAGLLLELEDRGKKLVQEHCVPLMVECVANGIEALDGGRADTVTTANSRYADVPGTYGALVGNISHFEMGLDGFNGKPNGDNVELQMKLEFADSTEFKTSNYGGVITSPVIEWEFVVNPQEGKVYPGEVGLLKPDGSRHPGRNRKTVDELMKLKITREAKLTREEVIAIRLYTGPAYMQLNRGLRNGGRMAKDKGIPNFPATCAAMNSGIKKIRLCTPLPKGRKLYRGRSGMFLPQSVLDAGAFAELAFASATPNPEVAKMYAGSKQASLFEIEVSQIDRGAFIGEFSQYEAEEEHVLPPLSHFEILSKTRKFNVNVYRLKINCNLRAQTLEEIRGNRRSTVLDLAQKLNQEFQELMDREAREIAKILAGSVDPVGPEYFNQGDHFSEIISKLEKAFVKELEEAAAALHESAKAIPEGEREEDRLAKLRLRLKIRRRCSQDNAAGKQAVLAAHEDLVAALVSCGASDSEAADDMIELAEVREKTASNFAGALKLLEDALQLKRALTPPSPPADQALILHRQGRVYDALGRYQESLEYYGQALDIRVQVFGREHLDVAKSQEGIAIVYEQQGKFKEALEMYSVVLETKTRVVGHGHLDVAKTYCNMANVYESQGLFERALEFYQKDLDITVNILGQDCPDVAGTYMNIGVVHDSLGNFEEALFHYGKAQEVFIAVFSGEHLEVAKTYNNQAIVYRKLGRYDEALEAYSKSLDIKIKVVGHGHLDVAATYCNMAIVFQNQGQYEKALEYYQKDLDITIKVVGHGHLTVAETQNNIANVYLQQGKFEEALEMYSAVLEIKTRVCGQHSPSVAQTLKNIGIVHQNQGKRAEAKEFFSRAYTIFLDKLGPDHPETTMLKPLA